ncbi:hypothetical protein TRFO_15233 [Tritrichomonas foetus]|uniref:Uncharacterized protein n=1 Tax=Tritrichomonas foetus TaxID=1144522 RepID=A0A1J4KXK3_9EUKA|nr:hypothetical protein TRFO_15233 [Tritrichomonas foetus]|eukprot:OHT14438.1 hypothetical protein TRFO_15233 [Tritrichomonas foetus]
MLFSLLMIHTKSIQTIYEVTDKLSFYPTLEELKDFSENGSLFLDITFQSNRPNSLYILKCNVKMTRLNRKPCKCHNSKFETVYKNKSMEILYTTHKKSYSRVTEYLYSSRNSIDVWTIAFPDDMCRDGIIYYNGYPLIFEHFQRNDKKCMFIQNYDKEHREFKNFAKNDNITIYEVETSSINSAVITFSISNSFLLFPRILLRFNFSWSINEIKTLVFICTVISIIILIVILNRDHNRPNNYRHSDPIIFSTYNAHIFHRNRYFLSSSDEDFDGSFDNAFQDSFSDSFGDSFSD